MTTQLTAPANCGGLTTDGGIEYVPVNGIIEVPDEVVAEALSHGFTLIDTSVPAQVVTLDFTKMKKNDLLAYAKDKLGLDLNPGDTNAVLISQIQAAQDTGE